MVFQFRIIKVYWFIQCDDHGLQYENLKGNQNKIEAKGERGGGPSIDYIYKNPDRLLHSTT